LSRYINTAAKTDYTYRKPNRRYFPDVYLPTAHSEALDEIAIAVDCSGSVSDKEFSQAVTEITKIVTALKPKSISLIQFDHGILSINKVTNLHELSAIKFTGKGGTDVEPVIQWASQNKPTVMLVFTDGHFHNKVATVIPWIWLVYNNPNFKGNFGKTIHYSV